MPAPHPEHIDIDAVYELVNESLRALQVWVVEKQKWTHYKTSNPNQKYPGLGDTSYGWCAQTFCALLLTPDNTHNFVDRTHALRLAVATIVATDETISHVFTNNKFDRNLFIRFLQDAYHRALEHQQQVREKWLQEINTHLPQLGQKNMAP